ncbi:MAG: hypothetical protein E7344_01600 [Clostridiales bacterium]|nr:hypothetical protein [Clostridiales bacterium]
MAKRMKVIVLACVSLVMCLALIATGTYALFTDQVSVSNHLQAGTLKITLTRTDLQYVALDDSGFLKAGQDTQQMSFTSTNSAQENVFGIKEGDLVVPKSEYTATMTIGNNGSVAASYWIEIKLGKNVDAQLAKQLKVEVWADGQTQSQGGELGDISIGSSNAPVGVVKANKSQTFKVKVSFVDDDAINNLAKGKQVSFDLIVSASQATK